MVYLEDDFLPAATGLITTNLTSGDTYVVAPAPALVLNQWHCLQLTVET